jgi:hypothetical protein
MNLKIVNETAASFNESVGISEERSNELSLKMDLMMKTYVAENRLVRICHVMEEIAMLCNSTEELVFCVITHCNWAMMAKGIIYNPTKVSR